jgi:hypothetical protein
MPPRTAAWALTALALAPSAASAGGAPDLSKVDRAIRKEPAYVAKTPLYGLAVFGPGADKRVWMVLDKSRPDSPYDVLHIDLNADGDLTGAGERLAAQGGAFTLAEFTDPATGVRHPDLSVRLSPADSADPTVMLSMRWRGRFNFGGGYPEDPGPGYMRFAPSRAEAPVFWVNGDAPFRFQRWLGGTLPIGGEDDLKVFLGQPGVGRATFCAAKEHFLPEKEFVRATLIYRDGQGKEQRAVSELRERC